MARIRRDFLGSAMGAERLFDPPRGRIDFFWGGPQKSPLGFLRRSALCPTTWVPHFRPLFRKGRGDKDLEQSAAMLDFIPSALAPSRSSDFFGVHPKKVPLF